MMSGQINQPGLPRTSLRTYMLSVKILFRRSAFALVCCLLMVTEIAFAGQSTVKVSRVSGETIELVGDSELLPRPGDKVEIFIELRAIKSTALVTKGTVTGL